MFITLISLYCIQLYLSLCAGKLSDYKTGAESKSRFRIWRAAKGFCVLSILYPRRKVRTDMVSYPLLTITKLLRLSPNILTIIDGWDKRMANSKKNVCKAAFFHAHTYLVRGIVFSYAYSFGLCRGKPFFNGLQTYCYPGNKAKSTPG